MRRRESYLSKTVVTEAIAVYLQMTFWIFVLVVPLLLFGRLAYLKATNTAIRSASVSIALAFASGAIVLGFICSTLADQLARGRKTARFAASLLFLALSVAAVFAGTGASSQNQQLNWYSRGVVSLIAS